MFKSKPINSRSVVSKHIAYGFQKDQRHMLNV